MVDKLDIPGNPPSKKKIKNFGTWPVAKSPAVSVSLGAMDSNLTHSRCTSFFSRSSTVDVGVAL